MWPVPFPAITEIVQGFSTSTLLTPKSLSPIAANGTDFLGILNSFNFIPHSVDVPDLPTNSRPESPGSIDPETTTTSRKPSVRGSASMEEQPEQTTSAILKSYSPIATTVTYNSNWDNLPATLSLQVSGSVSAMLDQSNNNERPPIEGMQMEPAAPINPPSGNALQSTTFASAPRSNPISPSTKSKTNGNEFLKIAPTESAEASAAAKAERSTDIVEVKAPEALPSQEHFGISSTDSAANGGADRQTNSLDTVPKSDTVPKFDTGPKLEPQITKPVAVFHRSTGIEAANTPLPMNGKFATRSAAPAPLSSSWHINEKPSAVAWTPLQNAKVDPLQLSSSPIEPSDIPPPSLRQTQSGSAFQRDDKDALTKFAPQLVDPGEELRSTARPTPPEQNSTEEVALPSALLPVAPIPTVLVAVPVPDAPLPPSATSQPNSRVPDDNKDRRPLLPGGQLVAKLSPPSASQPGFTAFEARLSPRFTQAKPQEDVSPSPKFPGTATIPEAQRSETSFQAPSAKAPSQQLNSEDDAIKPKNSAPIQPTAFEAASSSLKAEKVSEAISLTARPIGSRRQEPAERQVSTTQIQTPQSPAVARPPVHQQSKPDAPVSGATLPDVKELPVPQAGPARDISFRLGNSAADSVNVRIEDRAGQIHVAVQSGDSAVAQTLQSSVKELANNLENSGFHTETFIPGRTQTMPDVQQNSAFQDFQQNRRAPEQEQRAQKKRRSSEDATFTLIPNQENQ